MRRALYAVLLLLATAIAQAQITPGRPRQFDKVSWGLCVAADCAVAANLTVPYIAVAKSRFLKCYAAAKTGPAGAALVFDIKVRGVSIFGAGAKLQIAAGATTGTTATFAAPTISQDGNQVTIDITQVGSTTPGKEVSIACRLLL